MLLKTVSMLLILTLLATSSGASVGEESQAVPEMRRLAMNAVEKNRQLTLVLKTKRDSKKKFTGRPSNVSEQGLTLTDTRSGRQNQFDFADVREVRMKGSHTGLYVGIGIAAGLAVVVLAVMFSKLSSD